LLKKQQSPTTEPQKNPNQQGERDKLRQHQGKNRGTDERFGRENERGNSNDVQNSPKKDVSLQFDRRRI